VSSVMPMRRRLCRACSCQARGSLTRLMSSPACLDLPSMAYSGLELPTRSTWVGNDLAPFHTYVLTDDELTAMLDPGDLAIGLKKINVMPAKAAEEEVDK
jgi:hypothetical protein